ncbi:MAG: adenylate/guanylate cyclase domain-containing protein [Balneolaceae bacterium]
MKAKTKNRLHLFLYTVIFWVISSILYHILRRIGIGGEIGIDFIAPVSKLEGFRIAFFLGLITGFFYASLELVFENTWLQRKSLGVRMMIKTVSYTFLIGLVMTIAINYVNTIIGVSESMSRTQIIESGAIFSIATFFILSSSFYSFLRMVNEKFGQGILWDMILGKYRKPRIEKKIFMFLDLTSSTTLAETMGYLKYSSLIQQCFYDLNEVVQKYEGQIYQYVGDEAVICWDYEQGIKENVCVDLYFAFQQKLYRKKEFYEQEFGLLPHFKAGIHGGELVVTEVGIIPKEIAYHGDVINTTARIQGECTNYGVELLISGDLMQDLKLEAKHLANAIGEVVLKGKEKPVQIYSLSKG